MKWLKGIFSRICKSRLRYLMKFVSVLEVRQPRLANSEKKSSGTMAPKRSPWLRLKETTPFPNKSGLMLYSKFTTFRVCDLFSDGFEDAAGTLEAIAS